MLHFVPLLSLLISSTHAIIGTPCSTSNNRLDPSTHHFQSDCEVTEFCSNSTTPDVIPGGVVQPEDAPEETPGLIDIFTKRDSSPPAPGFTCQRRGCRRDEFPFGYKPGDTVPPMCPTGQACPDEGDACRPLVPLAGACQFGRDDQCISPPVDLAISTGNGFDPSDYNGAICLNYQCMWTNVQFDQPCVMENIAYSGFLPNGSEFSDIVTRSNCQAPNLYCNAVTLHCAYTFSNEAVCETNAQCQSQNCGKDEKCVAPPETPRSLGAGIYIVTVLCILGGMGTLVWTLWKYHLKAKSKRREERRLYWEQQFAFRQSLSAFRKAQLGMMEPVFDGLRHRDMALTPALRQM